MGQDVGGHRLHVVWKDVIAARDGRQGTGGAEEREAGARATPQLERGIGPCLSLPEAQLDRFLLRLKIGYPDEDGEDEILSRFEARNPLDDLTPVVEAEELVRLIAALGRLHVEPAVRRYAVRLVRETRADASFELGGSPRASLALFRASRALAAVSGRDYVLPDDVKTMAAYVLPHRLILSTQARLRGRDADQILADVIARVPVPVE